MREAGFEPGNPQLKLLLDLAGQLHGVSAAPVAARRRFRDLAGTARGAGAHRKRRDGRIAPSSSGTRTISTSWACSRWTCWGSACCRRCGAVSRCVRGLPPQAVRRSPTCPRKTARLRDDLARRHHRRVPGRIARADVDAAAPEAHGVLRSGDRGGHRAPGSHPGRHGASLSTPPAGTRAGHLSERCGRKACWRARSACPSSRSR